MYVPYCLLIAQKQTLDSQWGVCCSLIDLSPGLLTGKELVAPALMKWLPSLWLHPWSHLEVTSIPPEMGLRGCSAKSAHSPEHFEAKESWGKSSCNNASNDTFFHYSSLPT